MLHNFCNYILDRELKYTPLLFDKCIVIHFHFCFVVGVLVNFKCRLNYKHCFIAHRNQPSQQSLTNCIDSHNAYVQQLHTTNAMLTEYYSETIPVLMADLEDIYADLCQIVSDAIFNGSDIIASKVNRNYHALHQFNCMRISNIYIYIRATCYLLRATGYRIWYIFFIFFAMCQIQASDQKKRFDNLAVQCKNISPDQDLNCFVKMLQPDPQAKVPKKSYAPPANDADEVCTALLSHTWQSLCIFKDFVKNHDRNGKMQNAM